MTRMLLIVGSSARAAAQSTLRAGWQPFAIDQFADEDLLACCPAKRIDVYPRGIAELASQFPGCPFLYTGAMENHPEVIETLGRDRLLLGNAVDVVRAVRDPWTLHEKLVEQQLLAPELRRADESLQPGAWLDKPLRSGGGIGIRRIECVEGEPLIVRPSVRTHYRQRFVPGQPISALYIAAHGQASLLGVTRQLVGCAWAGAEQFYYVGNVGPLVVPGAVVRQLQRIGSVLAREFQLLGLFGIDAILNSDAVWTLEVNPRYTGAVEILERSLGLLALRLHVEACEHLRLPTVDLDWDRAPHGKAILYARCSLVVPGEFSRWVAARNSDAHYSVVADLPAAGTAIARGVPVCTVFATAPSETDVVNALRDLAREVFAVVEIGRIGRS